MQNRFVIVIDAKDNASKPVKALRRKLEEINAPIEKIKKAKEAIERTPFLDHMVKGFAEVGGAAVRASSSLARLSGPADAFLAFGGSGAAGLAAMTAALGDLIGRYAQMGNTVARTSRLTGISTTNIQSLVGAGRLLGVSADATTASLSRLGMVMQDAYSGRNDVARNLFAQLGLKLNRTKDGAMDAADMFRQMADVVVRSHNPETARTIAQAFGLDDSMILLMRRGSDGLRGLEDRARALGAVVGPEAVQRANAFARSLDALGVAAEGAGWKVADKFVPALTDAADAWTRMLSRGGPGSTWAKAETVLAGVAGGVGGFFLGGPFGALVGAGVGAGAGVVGTGLEEADRSRSASSLSFPMPPAPARTDTLGMRPNNPGNLRAGVGAGAGVVGAGLEEADRSRSASSLSFPMPPAPARTDTLGMRLNNPGNLRASVGQIGTSHGYAVFQSRQAGLAALVRQLDRYRDRGMDTLAQIISTYAPAADGNNVGAYLDDVSRRTGYGANQPLDLANSATMAAIVSAMVRHEQGFQPFSASQIRSAVDGTLKVDVTVHGAPGASVRVQSDDLPLGPTRVRYTMPTTVTP